MNTNKKLKRRSPIKVPPLSTPGASLHAQQIDVLFDQGAGWLMIAAFLIILAAVEWARWIWSIPPAPYIATAVAVVVAIIAIIKGRRSLQQANQFQLGREGELSVAEILEPLRSSGFRVYHDVQENNFNIDHIIIGPPGAFVIETKTVSMLANKENKIRFDGSKVWINGHTPDRDPIEQVRACAQHFGQLVARITGRAIPVRPVVLFPGWWVEPQPRNVDVWVLNPKVLPSFLGQESKRLSETEIALFSEALETYIRAKVVARG